MENTHFQKFCALLRPGYKPVDRHTLADKLLDKIYEEEQNNCAISLKGEPVCLSIDGWSNLRNEPIISAAITKGDGDVILAESVDTSGTSHTITNLLIIGSRIKTDTELKYECEVLSLVTDNAYNVRGMANALSETASSPLLTYGCTAHALNLLAHDVCKLVNFQNVQQHVVQILKYIRNHQLPKALYETAGGSALSIPIDVRWNSVSDSLQSYLKNWGVLVSISEKRNENGDFEIETAISNVPFILAFLIN